MGQAECTERLWTTTVTNLTGSCVAAARTFHGRALRLSTSQSRPPGRCIHLAFGACEASGQGMTSEGRDPIAPDGDRSSTRTRHTPLPHGGPTMFQCLFGHCCLDTLMGLPSSARCSLCIPNEAEESATGLFSGPYCCGGERCCASQLASSPPHLATAVTRAEGSDRTVTLEQSLWRLVAW